MKQVEAGMLLCLCSQSTEADVDAGFAHHPDMPLQPEHFISQRLGMESAARDCGRSPKSFS